SLGTPGAGASVVLHTTAHHPFWDATDHRWVDAGSLQTGHKLTGPQGQTQYVAAVHNYTGVKDMRNLTVSGIHTYYVMAGSVPVLVHNCGGLFSGLRQTRQAYVDGARSISEDGAARLAAGEDPLAVAQDAVDARNALKVDVRASMPAPLRWWAERR